MKNVTRILGAFVTFVVSFSPIEALEQEACFKLNVNFWSTGDMFYQWHGTPTTLPITLQCPTGMYVQLATMLNYAIPKYSDKYCLTNSRLYNFNEHSGCEYSSPCSCCNKPRTEDELCLYEIPFTEVIRSSEIQTCRTRDTCTVNVQRTEIPTTNPQCQDYACRDADTSTAGGQYSRCYSRWVTVTYDCTTTPPPTTPTPRPPPTPTPAHTTTYTTTTTPRPPPTTTSAPTTTTSTTTSQTTTTTSTSTIKATTTTPIPSSTTYTPPVTTTPASQSSTVSTSAEPGSPWVSTTLTQTGAGSTEANTAASSAGINIGLVAGLCVCLLIILIGIGAGIIMLFLYRKKQRTQDRNSAAGSVYYNVSPSTPAQPQPVHNMAPKIPQRKPQADNTDTYEEVTVKNNESLSPEAIQFDYYNIRGINDWNEVERSVYEMPVRDVNEIRESSNTGNVYQQLDNTATGSIADTTAAVDYENLAISSDYITVD